MSQSLGSQITSNLALGSLLLVTTCTWSQKRGTQYRALPPAAASQTRTTIGHAADTNSGRGVSSTTGKQPTGTNNNDRGSTGMSGGEEAGIIVGSIGAAAASIALGVHQYDYKHPKASDLEKNGPRVAKAVSMNHLIVEGIIGPGWPVGLDFQLNGTGYATLDITTEDKVQYHQVLTNDLNGRGITITHPDGLPDKLQSATFDVETAAPAGSNGPPPDIRVYGMAAGPNAVGSIAIDQVTFGPSAVKMKQDAQYGFHSHSNFSDVRADFMFAGLKDNHIVMKQENETALYPVTPDEHAQGSLQTKGTIGQHLLQIRAWRGNNGDWVVAWSPDVVILAK
jgi:hypothetical protein